jgi:signal recognition particle GTPase
MQQTRTSWASPLTRLCAHPPLQPPGAAVMLAPGDTFRAAAAEQLAEWAKRSGARMGTFREGARVGGARQA